MKRGEIYYIERSSYGETGSEQRSGRPAVIVSNDKCNEYSEVLEVVFLTTQPKNDLPTHIDIRSSSKPSVALCEQINSVAIQRFGEYIGTCSEYEMTMIDAALAISLGLEFEKKTEKKEEKKIEPKKVGGGEPIGKPVVDDEQIKKKDEEIVRLTAERDTFKALYDQLFDRMLASR